MGFVNGTSADRFFLLDIASTPSLKMISFLALLLMYMAILSGNFLLIIMVSINRKLQTPMYFFLSNLSIIDICFSSTVIPKILFNTLSNHNSISKAECAIQMHFHLNLGSVECFILTIMAYDRYVAICKPLHYNIFMSNKMCFALATASWSAGFVNSTGHIIYAMELLFCGTPHINHFFCELPQFIQTSCSANTWLHELAMYISAVIVSTLTFCFTLISYIPIVHTILRISSLKGRNKAFSTCASHFIVVILYYCTIMVMYLRPHNSYFPNIDKYVPVLYSAISPMLNPLIYSIRNKDIKDAIRKSLSM